MYDVTHYPNINRIWTGLLIDTLIQRGIKSFFTSPGLRNAPILSSIQKNTNCKVYSGIDERSMSYRALGYAKSSGVPGVLVCTSGTAMANYLPAVIEASQTNTPMLILTADRPKKLVDWGDNQAIKQPGLFGSFIRSELNLELPTEKTSAQDLLDKICRFLDEVELSGPLHINMPFDEPLDLGLDQTSDSYREECNRARATKAIYQSRYDYELPILDKEKRALVVVGPMPEFQNKKVILDLLEKTKLPCLLDIGSGLKFSSIDSNRVLPSFEHPEIKDLLTHDRPELIIHLGGRLVSKHYYTFLRENPEIELLLVGNQGLYTHPAQNPAWQLKVPLEDFCKRALEEKYLENQSAFIFDCKNIVGTKEEIIEKSSFSFPVISKKLIELMPDGASLFLGNSTSIRSFDAFASTKTHGKEIKVITHRGVSGIEGFNASALGYAEESQSPTILVHGDIGFMHDLSSLLMYKNQKLPLINIVVNNQGGGIFKHLSIAKDSETLPLITTEHELNFKGLCSWLELEYVNVKDSLAFEREFLNALHKKSICIIEASIDQAENLKVYEKLKTLKL